MKVHFIIGKFGGGGAERVMGLLCNHFAGQGHDVTLITMNGSSASFDLTDKIKRVDIDKGKFPLIRIRNLINLIGYYKGKRNRPDMAISFLTASNITAILGCRYRRIPIIASEHNNHLAVARPRWLTKLCWKYVYPLADYLTVLTSFDIPYFEKKGVNVVVMPNPCSFEVLEEKQQTREKIILAVGKLDRYHHKGFDNLIHMIKPVLKQHSDWKLHIVGDGEKGKQFLSAIVEKKGLKEQVYFLGFRNDIPQIMQKSAIFILPSRFEGLPMVLLEAMSQGMACIAFDCTTGPGDLIHDGENGLLIPDQNMHALKSGLKHLIQNETLRVALGENAKKSLDEYSIEAIYERWQQLMEKIRCKKE